MSAIPPAAARRPGNPKEVRPVEPAVLTRDEAIPLQRAALCMDCETIFRLERIICPCGSHAIIPLQRFLVERIEGGA